MKFNISKNIELEKRKFDNFLFNEESLKKRLHVRKQIIKNYRYFQDNIHELDNPQKSKILIDKFVEDKFQEHDSKIDGIIQDWVELFEINKESIDRWFVQTLGYDPSQDEVSIHPSFIPFHTFGKNSVSFSIIMEIWKNTKNNNLDIFLHEYTHIIWNRLLESHKVKVDKLSPIGYDYLKEFIPPIVIRHSIWDNIRQWEYGKLANPRQQLLNVAVKWHILSFVDYLETIYIENNYGKWIDKTINQFIDIILPVQDQIEQKHKIFDQIGYDNSNHLESFKLLSNAGFMEEIEII